MHFVLIFTLVVISSAASQTVEPEALYGKALETLASLEPRQPVFPEDLRTGSQQEPESPIVWRLAGYLFRHYVSGFLPDWLTLGRPSPLKRRPSASAVDDELVGKAQGAIDPKDIPSISPSDSKSLKRAKAIRLLELAGYQMAHQPSLMTLGNLFLVSCFFLLLQGQFNLVIPP